MEKYLFANVCQLSGDSVFDGHIHGLVDVFDRQIKVIVCFNQLNAVTNTRHDLVDFHVFDSTNLFIKITVNERVMKITFLLKERS